MPYVRHKLGRTFFVARGRGTDVPLIFLHGGPGGSHEYGLSLFALGKSRRVFLYDQLGGGKSSPTKRSHWTVKTFVREFDLLVEKWGLESFHLAGASWGATLALEVYLNRKGRGIRSLTFQSPLFSAADWKRDADFLIARLPPKTRRVIERCHEIGATDAKVYREAMLAFYRRHVLRNERMRRRLGKKAGTEKNTGGQIYQHMWGPSEFHATGTLKRYGRVGSLGRIRVPTLFLCGEFDEARPETMRRYSRRVRGSRVKVLKGCSHAILFEQPRLMVRAMAEFLRE